jgi:hypothetical protein
MLWLSHTVRLSVDTSNCTSTGTKALSEYEKGGTPIRSVQLLELEDSQHLFQNILFSDIPRTSRSRLGMTTEIEQDVRDGLYQTPTEVISISNEDKLAGYYDEWVLRPAAEMARIILGSDQCPAELKGLETSLLQISALTSSARNIANPDRLVVLSES